MSDQEYLSALMVFIVSYTVFETPYNYMLRRFRPSRWLAFLMFGWGSMTMILAASHNFGTVVAIRFLLGAFEAGLFPGLLFCLTLWYKFEERALRIAFILVCATLAGAFGGAIPFGVGHINQAGGLQAWRWLFLIEGAPSCAAAFLVLLFFPDFPETEKWLSTGERELAVERLKGVGSLGHDKIVWIETKATSVDWRLYLHYLVFVAVSVLFSSLSLFTPTIVSGLGYEGFDAQLFTVPPYAVAFVLTVFVSRLSDKHEARSLGTFISLVIAGISFLVQGELFFSLFRSWKVVLTVWVTEGALPEASFNARYGMLCVAVSFSFSSLSPLLSWLCKSAKYRCCNVSHPTECIDRTIKTDSWFVRGIVPHILYLTLEILGVYIYKISEAPRYPTGHFTNAAFLIGGAIIVLILRRIYSKRNRALREGERKWRL